MMAQNRGLVESNVVTTSIVGLPLVRGIDGTILDFSTFSGSS